VKLQGRRDQANSHWRRIRLGGAAGETLEGGIDWPRSCGGGGAGALSDRIKRAREREGQGGGRWDWWWAMGGGLGAKRLDFWWRKRRVESMCLCERAASGKGKTKAGRKEMAMRSQGRRRDCRSTTRSWIASSCALPCACPSSSSLGLFFYSLT
jgi:hypothetical protein